MEISPHSLLWGTIVGFVLLAYLARWYFRSDLNPVTILLISHVPGMLILVLNVFRFLPVSTVYRI